MSDRLLARIIYEGVYCNRRYKNQNSLRYSFFAPGIIQRALDLASAVATHLPAGLPLGRSTSCFKYASLPSQARLWSLPRLLLQRGAPPSELLGVATPRLADPHARLAWRLDGFVKNPRE
jgi:hypothetical protein